MAASRAPAWRRFIDDSLRRRPEAEARRPLSDDEWAVLSDQDRALEGTPNRDMAAVVADLIVGVTADGAVQDYSHHYSEHDAS